MTTETQDFSSNDQFKGVTIRNFLVTGPYGNVRGRIDGTKLEISADTELLQYFAKGVLSGAAIGIDEPGFRLSVNDGEIILESGKSEAP